MYSSGFYYRYIGYFSSYSKPQKGFMAGFYFILICIAIAPAMLISESRIIEFKNCTTQALTHCDAWYNNCVECSGFEIRLNKETDYFTLCKLNQDFSYNNCTLGFSINSKQRVVWWLVLWLTL